MPRAGLRARCTLDGRCCFTPRLSFSGFLPVVLAAYYSAARHARAREWTAACLRWSFTPGGTCASCRCCSGRRTATWGAAELYRRTRAHGLAVGRRCRQLRLARLLQVHGIPRGRPLRRLLGSTVAADLHHSADRHQLLHLPARLLPRRRRARRCASYPWRRITLFVSLFPHLIAGPIVRHREIMPQLDADPLRPGLAERFAKGLAFFVIGCAKKVFLADPLARFADPIFAAAATAGARRWSTPGTARSRSRCSCSSTSRPTARWPSASA